MQWREIDVTCSRLASEAVLAILNELIGGVVIEEQGGGLLYRAYVPLGIGREPVVETLRERFAALPDELLEEGAPALEMTTIDEEDWAESWKAFFEPLRIGQRIVVKPTWKAWPPEGQPDLARPDDLIIQLDPGMAFGTGSHATTWQCLEAVEKYLEPGCRLVDLGCGSGILTVGALKLGASEVLAIDNDDLATAATTANCELNGVSGARIILQAGLTGVESGWDMVVANISSVIIKAETPLVANVLRPGGLYIASGFYVGHEEEMLALMNECGFETVEALERELWSCLIVRKK